MSKIKKNCIIAFLLVIIFSLSFRIFEQEIPCSEIPRDEILNAISNEVTNKQITYWGLSFPPETKEKFTFNTNEIQSSEKVMLVPIEFHTQTNGKKYFATYICRSGKIEYSSGK